MKTLTYISKYHFVRMASLLILLMWQADVQAQADSTVTYTFNDTTMTFNLNEIRASLLQNTDLSSGEVEATLLYEPFWRSMFPLPTSNSYIIPSNQGKKMNDPCPDLEEGECIGFENIMTDGGGNVTSVFPWCTQTACVRYGLLYEGDSTDPTLQYGPIPWQGGGECGHSDADENIIPGFDVSVEPFEIITSSSTAHDPYVWRNGFNNVILLDAPSGNEHFIRIGDRIGGLHAHRVVGRFIVNGAKPILKYNYALAIQDTESLNTPHDGNTISDTEKPYFMLKFKTLNETTGLMEEIGCGTYSVVGTASQNSNFETTGITVGQHVPADLRINAGMVLNWQENIINLAQYAGKEVVIEATMTECTHGGHTGWAYLDIACEAEKFEVTKDGDGCTYNFATEYTGNYGQQNETYLWTFKDISGNVVGTSTSADPSFTFGEPGDYTVELTIAYCNFPNGNGGCVTCEIDNCTDPVCEYDCDNPTDGILETVRERCATTFTETITICCDYCASDFAPLPGSEYVISAWVKESNVPDARTYLSPNIELLFEGSPTTEEPFYATGNIIDGWQRIEAEFTVPADAEKIKVQLKNDGINDVFFDDVRIHPFDASMKSFVYDPVTLRLSAELDERNYATYYEYDEEGALIRIKKETERGIMTIQESRNGIRKQ